MKKIMSIIAALAMLMAMVGCDLSALGDGEFHEKTESIYEGKGSVYPITSCDKRSGDGIVDISFTNGTVTLKSIEQGNASMILESEALCKTANVNIYVNSLGSISGTYSLREYLYSRSTHTGSEYLWKDKTGTTNPLGLATGWYRATTNDEEDIASQGALSYIYVNGKIVYYVYYSSKDTSFDYCFDVYFVRTIMNGESGNITLTYDTQGDAFVGHEREIKYYNEKKYTGNTTKYGIYDDGNAMWTGTNWQKDGNTLTNCSVVYAPYDSTPPISDSNYVW